ARYNPLPTESHMPDDEPVTQPHGAAHPESVPTDHGTAGHATEPAPTRAAEAVTPPPLRIGRYAIVRTLGRGGMGVVYLARDARDRREVALKVIPAGPDADPTDLARFHSEAEAVARLDHPNIVKLFEVGEGDGVAFLAMEDVDGGSLYRRIKQNGPRSATQAARLVEEIARATHFAHTQGVVHRDLKPSNILMGSPRSSIPSPQSEDNRLRTGDSGLGTPKLADFGLAKQLDKSLRLTQTGIAVGTPHYMAPEQARGQAEYIGPLSDVHALGAILYELLVGHPPFGGGSPVETLPQGVEKKPVPPSQLRDGIPAELEAICLRCLEKSPAKRYRTAEAMADDLKAFRTGLGPDRSDDPTIHVQAAPPKQRSLVPVLGAAVLLAVVAAAGGWYFAARAKRADAEAARDEAHSATRAERRSRLEAAIAMCERGQIAVGLEQMRALESDEELPVREVIAAWD